jgi:hypothetical protein
LLVGLSAGQRATGTHDDAVAFAWHLVDEFACDLGEFGVGAPKSGHDDAAPAVPACHGGRPGRQRCP